MGDVPHAPHTCDGKVRVHSSEPFVRLLKTFVHKERGVCGKCGAELLGYASFALNGVRIGVRAWFPQRQPAPESFDPPV